MTDQPSSVDDLLDAHAPNQSMDVDSLLDQHAPAQPGPFYPGVDARLPKVPPIQPLANTSDQFNQWFKGTPEGRITDAFVGGVKTGWEGMALSPESEDFFKKLGWFNDPKKPSFMGGFNDTFMRPAVMAANAALRVGAAGYSGVQAGIVQAGEEANNATGGVFGLNKLGRDVTGIMDMEAMGFPFGSKFHPAPAKFWNDAIKNKVIGGDDAVYFGLKEPEPLADGALADDLKSSVKPLEDQLAEQGAAGAEAQATPEATPVQATTQEAQPDIHSIARQIDPDTFEKYDALVARRDTYRKWLNELSETRDEAHANREDVKSINSEIDDILAKVNGVEDRLTKRQAGRLSDLRDQLDEIESTAKLDSPDMARIRRVLQENDYKMRDLAPDVTKAYREAQERMPQEAAPEVEQAVDEARVQGREQGETETAQPKNETVTETAKPVETKPGEPAAEGVKPDETPAKTELPIEQQKAQIASRVARQLEDAGRPRDEAEAAAQLIAARYETRAARMGGKLGSPLELFNRDGAVIQAARERVREMAQKKDQAPEITAKEYEQAKRGSVQFRENKTIIKLFKGADASTFIHETGHKFLEEMMADAVHEAAPDQIKADAATVRKWLGVSEDEAIPTRAHEKFARGFERYLMEGRAPSQTLARVFDQFKQWLTKIYETVTRLKSPINDDIRDVFDRLLSTNPEKVTIAPDRALGADFATLHEGDAEHTPGNQAKVVGDRVRDERHAVADEHASEISDELQPGRIGNGPGESPARSEGADSGVNASGPDTGTNGAIQKSGTVGAGGGQAKVEGIGPPQESNLKFGPSSKQKLYSKVPARPSTLTDFVRSYGGIGNDRGDIAALFGGKRNGGVLRKTGKDIDRVAQAAEEAGFFPELGGERPTINQFLEKLTRDVNGDHQFSDFDYDKVKAYQDALNHNSEVDRIAGELGIKADGMSHSEFWNEVASRMSTEEQLKEIHSQEADFERELRHAEEWAKSHLEAKGDAWEGDNVPDYDNPRTEEDLENEYRAEESARGPIKSADDGGQSGPAGGGAVDVQESSGSRGRSTRSNGSKTEYPAGPNERFATDESDLVDKAGNIRLDNLNTPEDVKEVLRQTAADNEDFMAARRGVISAGEQLDLADALGMNAAKLNWRRIGEAFNAEQILAARKLLIQSATEVRDLMAKAANGSDADVMAYAKARQRHLMIQEQVAGITAEAGRALGAFRKLEGSADAEALAQFFQSTIGRTPEQLRQEAQFGMNLQTPGQVAKFVNDSARGSIKNAILEYYVNALISGPITHARYSVGNALNALARPLIEIPVASAVGAAREALGYEVKNRVYLGEAGAQLYGMMKGSSDGLMAATQAFKTGISPALPGEKVSGHFTDMNTRAIPGKVGEIINVPSKSVAAIHSFFKSLRYEQNIQSLAYREAMNDGLTGDAFKGRVAELTQKPTPEMMIAASADAMKELFMAPADYNSFSGKLTAAANSNLAAKIIVPFMKIGTQITREAFIERSPIGLLDRDVRGNLSGQNGGSAQDMQFGKIATGTALIGTSVMMTLNGLMTGDGPADPNERRVWLMANKPNHITIGDVSVAYDRLGPFAMLMRFGANMTEAAHGWDGEDGTVLAKAAFEGFNKAVLDETFMKGLSDMLNAVFHPEEYGESYIRGMVINWMPFSVGMSQVAHAVDPYQREARTLLDAAKAKVPFVSIGLLPKRDMFGEPIPQSGTADRYANDSVVKEMNALGLGVGKLRRSIRGQDLTDEQYDQYAQTAGRLAKMRLNALVQNPGWQQIPKNIRAETITKTISSSRTAAANMIAAQSVGGPNDIIKGAMEDKMRARNGE